MFYKCLSKNNYLMFQKVLHKNVYKWFKNIRMQTLLKHYFDGHNKYLKNSCCKHFANISQEKILNVYKNV